MHLVFDILQGIGVAAAVGIRPFLPALAVGALAAGDVQIDFAHTDLSFLQQAPFLLVMVLGSILLSMLERRTSGQQLERGPVALGISAAAMVIGALLFAATRPLLARVRTRLDREAAGALPVFTEAVALAGAALSVLAPPVGIVLLAFLLWLLLAGRGRGEQKFAGLRILR